MEEGEGRKHPGRIFVDRTENHGEAARCTTTRAERVFSGLYEPDVSLVWIT